jgi:hypothetical protein
MRTDIHTDGQTDGQTDSRQTERQTDMTKLIVAFRNFANGPKTGFQRIRMESVVGKAFRVFNRVYCL